MPPTVRPSDPTGKGQYDPHRRDRGQDGVVAQVPHVVASPRLLHSPDDTDAGFATGVAFAMRDALGDEGEVTSGKLRRLGYGRPLHGEDKAARLADAGDWRLVPERMLIEAGRVYDPGEAAGGSAMTRAFNRREVGHRRSSIRLTLVATLAAAALALPTMALGQDEVGTGTEKQPRDIPISMDDTLRFDPAHVSVGAGEVVRFILTNTGAATHDFLIGDLETQEEHGAEMAAGMTHMHGACPEADEHMDESADHVGSDEHAEADERADEHAEADEQEHADDEAGHAEADVPADEHMEAEEPADEAVLCPGGIPAPVTIEPGETVSVLARLDEPGETLIGCHQPGHWQAGMKGLITVIDTEGDAAS